jgi:protein-L-isoaspartate(D-aspartate) O-methyltransferase
MTKSKNASRQTFVAKQIAARGVADPLVLGAMRRVPRELFVPQDEVASAYLDRPLPIGEGQTISQPFIVAYMIEALGLKGGEKVLEIGAGSGYAAAVMGEIAGEVYAIERIGRLAAFAALNIAKAGCRNVQVREGDGTLGWPEAAPFDAILVSAGAPAVPGTLMSQLAIGGRMVVPVGNETHTQDLVRVTRRSETEFKQETLTGVRFVPLIGNEGWAE